MQVHEMEGMLVTTRSAFAEQRQGSGAVWVPSSRGGKKMVRRVGRWRRHDVTCAAVVGALQSVGPCIPVHRLSLSHTLSLTRERDCGGSARTILMFRVDVASAVRRRNVMGAVGGVSLRPDLSERQIHWYRDDNELASSGGLGSV